MKIVVTGAQGQLGRELTRQLGDHCLPLTRADLDITDRDSILRALSQLSAGALLNTAAYTQVDRAETDRAACRAVNVDAVGHLAEACEELGLALLHVSTDYVFGVAPAEESPWRENDPPSPQGVYARSKLEGEERARRCSRHYIVRSCGLYDGARPGGSTNFVKTMVRLGRERSEIRVVDDQWCTPTYVPHLVRAILHLLTTSKFGTYHVVNGGATTWCRFAAEIFRLTRLDVRSIPISSGELDLAAPRPPYSVLDSGKYHALGGPEMPVWQAALSECLTEAGPESVGGPRSERTP